MTEKAWLTEQLTSWWPGSRERGKGANVAPKDTPEYYISPNRLHLLLYTLS